MFAICHMTTSVVDEAKMFQNSFFFYFSMKNSLEMLHACLCDKITVDKTSKMANLMILALHLKKAIESI